MEPLDVGHAARLFPGLADPELYRYVPGDAPASVSALELRYRRVGAGPASPSERWYNWAVILGDGRAQVIGTVELSIVDGAQRAFLAYALVRDAWGLGYAREACAAALDFLRTRTPVREVTALIDTRNARSIALVERLGFERRETIEDADYFKGTTSHEYLYRLALQKENHGETERG
jgi:ribosomal-protein-alanine N-acetyltransferase